MRGWKAETLFHLFSDCLNLRHRHIQRELQLPQLLKSDIGKLPVSFRILLGKRWLLTMSGIIFESAKVIKYS
jgi:hypothetical protein